MKFRVLLADDHKLVLEGLSTLLEREDDIVVAGRAQNGPEAIAKAIELQPDLVIMDLSMPGMTGTEATQRIKTALPQVHIICLSMHAKEQFVSAAFRAGASGYILKDRAVEEVIKGVHAVMSGKTYFSPEIA